LIKNLFSFNKFLNLKIKTIVNKNKNIFIFVINYYTIVSLGKKKESSNKKEVKKIDIAKALKTKKNSKDIKATEER
jgi:hypothetical protein